MFPVLGYIISVRSLPSIHTWVYKQIPKRRVLLHAANKQNLTNKHSIHLETCESLFQEKKSMLRSLSLVSSGLVGFFKGHSIRRTFVEYWCYNIEYWSTNTDVSRTETSATNQLRDDPKDNNALPPSKVDREGPEDNARFQFLLISRPHTEVIRLFRPRKRQLVDTHMPLRIYLGGHSCA